MSMVRRNTLFLGCLLAACLLAISATAQNATQPGASEAGVAAPALSESGISQAEQHFQDGVALYKQGLYREALNLFQRALALEPGHANALEYKEKCSAKLSLSTVGAQDAQPAQFQTADPAALGQPEAQQPQVSAEELKRQRVEELLGKATLYM